MATFILFGRYSSQAVKDISAKRTEKTAALFSKYGGTFKSGYAVLGEYDLVLIGELPGIDEAVKTSLALSKMTGIDFTTCPAVTVEKFDQLAADT